MTRTFDLYAHITDAILTAIEAGAASCTAPWQRAGNILPANAATGATYHGINILSLWAEAMNRGYTHSLWASYRQWAELGAQVRKGERGSCIVFYKEYEAEPDPDDANDDGKRRVARASWVFNTAQVDGFDPPGMPDMPPIERIARAEALVSATKADIRYGGDQAYYAPETDHIQMPDERLFTESDSARRSQAFYAVLLHETVHWSGASHRLNRAAHTRFGDYAYGMEELIAELGAAFLCGELGISPEPRPDHAGYIGGWIAAMKADKRIIFGAAARASEAAAYLKRFSESAR